jgi:non-specific serine/threonine protein kinase
LQVPGASDLYRATEFTSLQLFCERAQAARAAFQLNPDQIPVVVEICRRLDGLPLAIELAAARLKLFSLPELLQRLEQRLPLLAQGPVDLPSHDQVLENAIAWSYGLLSPSERTLLNRLAVFVNGFTLLAVESICGPSAADIRLPAGGQAAPVLTDMTNGLAVLLDQSLLLRQEAGAASEYRFMMLDIIREYALERLRDSGEKNLLQHRHARYFTTWAERAVTFLYGPEQAAWLACMALEADNLRAALSWSLETGEIEMATRLACALAVFWRRRGHFSEGRNWLVQVLSQALPGCLPDALRARILQAAGSLAYRQGDWQTAQPWLEESLVLFRSFADRPGVARVLFDLGWIAIDQGDWTEAAYLNQESLALARQEEDALGMYRALTNLGWTMLCTGERTQAGELFGEAYVLARRVGHTRGMAVSLANLGWIALYQEDLGLASDQAAESLHLCYQLGEREVLAESLEILAVAAMRKNKLARAVQLSGAAQALWEALHVNPSLTHHSTTTHAEALTALRQELPPSVFEPAWQAGRAMSLDAIVQFVTANGPDR